MRITNRPAPIKAPGTHRSPELPIIEPPRLRREEEGHRPTSWLELFFDLVFVVAVDQVARRLNDDASVRGVLGFILLYGAVWWAWVGYVIYNDRFGTDDLSDRLLTLAQMGAVTVVAVRAHDAFGAGARAFALAYGTFRLLLALRYAIAAVYVREVRAPAARQALGFALAAGIWIASAAVSGDARYTLWGVGLLVDLGTPLLERGFHRVVRPDPGHLEERFGLFIIIVLGEGFVGLVDGLRGLAWVRGAGVTVTFALLLGFSLWWVYFETLDAAPVVEVRRGGRLWPYKLWVFGHFPLAAGIAAAGIGVGAVVRRAAAAPLPDAERWLLCGSLACCFAALAILQIAYAAVGGDRLRRRLARRKLVTAAAALAVAVLGRGLSSAVVMGLLTLEGAALVGLDLHYRAQLRRQSVQATPRPIS
jgi:low temperature requirement protein LtrA